MWISLVTYFLHTACYLSETLENVASLPLEATPFPWALDPITSNCCTLNLALFLRFSTFFLPLLLRKVQVFSSFFNKLFYSTTVSVECISAVQQSNSDIYIHTHIYIYVHIYIYIYIYIYIHTHTYIHVVFPILFHYGLSQDNQYSSLCYKVGPCCPSILHIRVSICQLQIFTLSHAPFLPTWQLQVCSLYLWVCFKISSCMSYFRFHM